jgi:hypothetical protein
MPPADTLKIELRGGSNAKRYRWQEAYHLYTERWMTYREIGEYYGVHTSTACRYVTQFERAEAKKGRRG